MSSHLLITYAGVAMCVRDFLIKQPLIVLLLLLSMLVGFIHPNCRYLQNHEWLLVYVRFVRFESGVCFNFVNKPCLIHFTLSILFSLPFRVIRTPQLCAHTCSFQNVYQCRTRVQTLDWRGHPSSISRFLRCSSCAWQGHD